MNRHPLLGGAMALALLAVGGGVAAQPTPSAAAVATGLKAGAARVDITPDASALPQGFLGVHDPIYARAIVVDNGRTRAAMVTVDAGAIGEDTWNAVADRAQRELGIPRDQLILTATHSHSVPRGAAPGYSDRVFEAVAQAASRLQPAQMAYGEGVSYINVNRNLIDRETHRWWEGPNYDGPSDKTVAVVRFATPDGKPIAVFYNYAVHAVINGQLDMVSGDIPGAASRYIEESLGDDAVAVWSTGAAGDQNPVFFQQTYDLREIRIADYARRGEDISNAMPPGGRGLDRQNPDVARLMNQQTRMAESMGQMLGEEVLHVTRANLDRSTASSDIAGGQSEFTCPGRRRTDTGRAGYPGTYVDADPISVRLSFLMVGDVMIGGVNAEVFNPIGQRFKREAPFKHTMMATLTNGMAMSGYIPNDAAYGYDTFEVISSRLKPGCAETAIVDGLLDLMGDARVVWAPSE